MRIAMIKDGIVLNIAIWDGVSNWDPGGYLLVDITDQNEVDIGWNYDGTNFINPNIQED